MKRRKDIFIGVDLAELHKRAKELERLVKKEGWEGVKLINRCREEVGKSKVNSMSVETVHRYMELLRSGYEEMVDIVTEMERVIEKLREIKSRFEEKIIDSEQVEDVVKELDNATMLLENTKAVLKDLL